MIPERTSVKDVESTVTGDEVKMTIDDAAMQHIMNVLTDLYGDPELAVLREYSTNALDAQREIGETRPIEVSLPNQLAPFLLIRDYGVGLSVDDIHNIYAKYGASTKRGTNDQVGMLGLGCKSALTYSDQFTVTSVQNGTRIQVVVARNANGAASMTVVETSATDDHSGTTVMIPAKRYNEFERKAKNFFRFWEPGTVLVNGEPPEPLDAGLKITDDIRISEDVDQSYIVMGNVAYPWADPKHGLSYRYHLVARVPIGGVSFPPSREALMYEDDVTNPTLKRVLEEFRLKSPEALTKAIEAAPTFQEALQLRIRWSNVMTNTGVKPVWSYKGHPMPNSIDSTYDKLTGAGDQFVVAHMNSHKLSAHSKMYGIPIHTVPHTMWVEDYDRPTFTAGQKKKLRRLYHEELSEALGTVDQVVFVRGTLSAEDRRWIDASHIIKWKRVSDVKLPQNRANGSSGKIPGSFDIYVTSGEYRHNVPGDELGKLAATASVYWIQGNNHAAYPYRTTLVADGKPFVLVCLPSNRVDKFQRTFPTAQRVQDVVKSRWDLWWKTVTPSQREALAIQRDYYTTNGLNKIDPAKVDDPEFCSAIKAAKKDIATVMGTLEDFKRLVPEARDAAAKLRSPQPWTKYPLVCLDEFTGANVEHIYRYINAEYAFLSQQKAIV